MKKIIVELIFLAHEKLLYKQKKIIYIAELFFLSVYLRETIDNIINKNSAQPWMYCKFIYNKFRLCGVGFSWHEWQFIYTKYISQKKTEKITDIISTRKYMGGRKKSIYALVNVNYCNNATVKRIWNAKTITLLFEAFRTLTSWITPCRVKHEQRLDNEILFIGELQC